MNTVSEDKFSDFEKLIESSVSESFKSDLVSLLQQATPLYKELMIAISDALKSIPKEKFIEMERMINYEYKR